MTIKEAILKSLEYLQKPATYLDVYKCIMEKNYYPHFEGKDTPSNTVSAQLGDFIRKSDSRVKRIKLPSGTLGYYLTKYEQAAGIDQINAQTAKEAEKKPDKQVTGYDEKDLHILLSSYLQVSNTHSKTIPHNQSLKSLDKHQIWTHPDMVGIRFTSLKTEETQNLQKAINRLDTFKISSFEIKKEVNYDSDLKEAFFQAVSNSSWANYGYLVALSFADNLEEEMERLNQAFGIGIIELNANPFQSKTKYPAKIRELDFKTIDKLCNNNDHFKKFVDQAEKILTAEKRYLSGTRKEMEEFCDKFLLTDSEAEEYCRKKNIPTEALLF
jgi:hypothetical protein